MLLEILYLSIQKFELLIIYNSNLISKFKSLDIFILIRVAYSYIDLIIWKQSLSYNKY